MLRPPKRQPHQRKHLTISTKFWREHKTLLPWRALYLTWESIAEKSDKEVYQSPNINVPGTKSLPLTICHPSTLHRELELWSWDIKSHSLNASNRSHALMSGPPSCQALNVAANWKRNPLEAEAASPRQMARSQERKIQMTSSPSNSRSDMTLTTMREILAKAMLRRSLTTGKNLTPSQTSEILQV